MKNINKKDLERRTQNIKDTTLLIVVVFFSIGLISMLEAKTWIPLG